MTYLHTYVYVCTYLFICSCVHTLIMHYCLATRAGSLIHIGTTVVLMDIYVCSYTKNTTHCFIYLKCRLQVYVMNGKKYISL